MQEWEIATRQVMNQLVYGVPASEIFNTLVKGGCTEDAAQKLLRFAKWRVKVETRNTIPEITLPE